MRLLDRHVLATFAAPLLYCLGTFLCIWLLFDLVDNGNDFLRGQVPILGILGFYLEQLPYIGLIVLPVGLLLAILYALGKLSRSNELMAMLGAGVGFPRIVVPLFFVGLAATGLSQWMSYEGAPRADATRQESIRRLANREINYLYYPAHLFRNRLEHRTWFVRELPFKEDAPLRGVEVTQQNPQGGITTKYYAEIADYDPVARVWHLQATKIAQYNDEGVLIRQTFPERLSVDFWTETPWRLHSSNMQPRHLTVPELRKYLEENRDFPDSQLAPFRTYLMHRFAVPWTCLLVVLIGAPLGFVQGRRGMLGGIAMSILLFFSMIFLTNFFLALGQGGRVSPLMAAWIPNLLFGSIGLLLFYMKSSNLEFSSLWNPCRHQRALRASTKAVSQAA